MNLTATVDDKRQFIDVDISHPGATSNYLAFVVGSLKQKLHDGQLLAPGKFIFGDNAYVNTQYMVTPYKTGDEFEDHYNFYHSQLYITVECTFRMIIQ